MSDAVPLTLGLYSWNILSRNMKILLWLFICVAFFDSISIYRVVNNSTHNMMELHIYTLLEFGFLMVILSNWQKTSNSRQFLKFTIPLFVLIWIVAKIYLEEPTRFDSFTSSLESAVLAGASAFTLLGFLRENPESLFKQPRFWVMGAILIYFSGNLVAFALRPVIMVWSIHSVLNIVSNLCYSGGFWCLRLQ